MESDMKLIIPNYEKKLNRPFLEINVWIKCNYLLKYISSNTLLTDSKWKILYDNCITNYTKLSTYCSPSPPLLNIKSEYIVTLKIPWLFSNIFHKIISKYNIPVFNISNIIDDEYKNYFTLMTYTVEIYIIQLANILMRIDTHHNLWYYVMLAKLIN